MNMAPAYKAADLYLKMNMAPAYKAADLYLKMNMAPAYTAADLYLKMNMAPAYKAADLYLKMNMAPAYTAADLYLKMNMAPAYKAADLYLKMNMAPAYKAADLYLKMNMAPAYKAADLYLKMNMAPAYKELNMLEMKWQGRLADVLHEFETQQNKLHSISQTIAISHIANKMGGKGARSHDMGASSHPEVARSRDNGPSGPPYSMGTPSGLQGSPRPRGGLGEGATQGGAQAAEARGGPLCPKEAEKLTDSSLQRSMPRGQESKDAIDVKLKVHDTMHGGPRPSSTVISEDLAFQHLVLHHPPPSSSVASEDRESRGQDRGQREDRTRRTAEDRAGQQRTEREEDREREQRSGGYPPEGVEWRVATRGVEGNRQREQWSGIYPPPSSSVASEDTEQRDRVGVHDRLQATRSTRSRGVEEREGVRGQGVGIEGVWGQGVAFSRGRESSKGDMGDDDDDEIGLLRRLLLGRLTSSATNAVSSSRCNGTSVAPSVLDSAIQDSEDSVKGRGGLQRRMTLERLAASVTCTNVNARVDGRAVGPKDLHRIKPREREQPQGRRAASVTRVEAPAVGTQDIHGVKPREQEQAQGKRSASVTRVEDSAVGPQGPQRYKLRAQEQPQGAALQPQHEHSVARELSFADGEKWGSKFGHAASLPQGSQGTNSSVEFMGGEITSPVGSLNVGRRLVAARGAINSIELGTSRVESLS
eukprot:gene16087-22229_t